METIKHAVLGKLSKQHPSGWLAIGNMCFGEYDLDPRCLVEIAVMPQHISSLSLGQHAHLAGTAIGEGVLRDGHGIYWKQ